MTTDWVRHAIWWQVYPLGFVGAFPADPAPTVDEHRLSRVTAWLDHALELGASGVALGPIFASRSHGYDTTDHYRIDPRLGDDGDFDRLVEEARARGLRILLDGVFNHVGTDFLATARPSMVEMHRGSARAVTVSRRSRGTTAFPRSTTTNRR